MGEDQWSHAEKSVVRGGARGHEARGDPKDFLMSDAIVLKPIGFGPGGRAEPIDDEWDSVEAVIELDAAQFKTDATASLGDFSHIEVVFHFNQVPDDEINNGAR